MYRSALLLTVLLGVLCPIASSVPLLPAGGDAAVPPDDAAAAHVKAGVNGKLSTDLVQLLDPSARLPGQSREAVVQGLRSQRAYRGPSGSVGAASTGGEEVFVYVSLVESNPTALVDPYARVVNRDEEHALVSAWVATVQLPALASQPFVRSVRTVTPAFVEAGSVTTEGDGLLDAALYRAESGCSGAGVKVGVIADGVDSRAQAVATGDLPADLQVLSNAQGGDEGTAMAEIIHDIAPNAPLFFHDMGPDRIGFNQAVTALAAAGCRVIVDDIVWLDDAQFEDGIVAQQKTGIIESHGIVYVNAAGNAAEEHYQGPFREQAGTSAGWHDFSGGSATGKQGLYVTVPGGGSVWVVLQWDDQFGRSENDYDLYLTENGDSSRVVALSVAQQNGDDDPLEIVHYLNTGGSAADLQIWVKRFMGQNRTVEVYVLPLGGASVSAVNTVAADSIPGNMGAAGAITVAAAPATLPLALRPFSSQGPVTHRWPVPEARQKPDIAGPDGVLISGAGGWGWWDGAHFRFYGTSAAAPHVAGLAALVWSGRPGATNDEVRAALLESAQDRGPAGFDPGWGNGWPDACAFAERLGAGPAVLAVPPSTAVPTDTDADERYEDVNGNGRKDFADVVLYFNQMTWIAANEPVAPFDYNGNGRIDFADIVWLFNRL